MLNLDKNINTILPVEEYSPSLIKFVSAFSSVLEPKDFLLALKANIPKKFKTGELLLFYQSEQMGLRRAYVKKGIFYEQSAKAFWPCVQQPQLSSKEENIYLAKEFGRPFSSALMIPLFSSSGLLIVELEKLSFVPELISFFEQRMLCLRLVFKKAHSNTSLSRVSYLWSQLFSYWEEPLAILRNFKVVRRNESFRKELSHAKDFLKQKKVSGFLSVGEKKYQLYYYPLRDLMGILYAQDITHQFLLKAQLFQTEKMSALCELGQNIAHQLNNPLAGVKAMTQILKQQTDLKAFFQELEELEKAMERSEKIIQSVLSFSELKETKELCDLNQVLEGTLPLLKSMTKGICLEKKLHNKALKVCGSFAVFQQIVYNLILNACQALSEDKNNPEPKISITTKKLAGNKVCLKIKDNGIGIPKAHLEKIFQPFWTNKKNGTGFGLGITKQFVEKSGGKLFVSSKEKEFACFTILLPCVDS